MKKCLKNSQIIRCDVSVSDNQSEDRLYSVHSNNTVKVRLTVCNIHCLSVLIPFSPLLVLFLTTFLTVRENLMIFDNFSTVWTNDMFRLEIQQ